MASSKKIGIIMMEEEDLKKSYPELYHIWEKQNKRYYSSAKKSEKNGPNLKKFGIPCSILGYQYLQYAINIYIPGMKITKDLYPKVAKRFETTPTRVERAIRHAIEIGWERGEPKVFDSIFGSSVNNRKIKPTNAEFISAMSEYMK